MPCRAWPRSSGPTSRRSSSTSTAPPAWSRGWSCRDVFTTLAGLPRLALRQRLQPLRPHLAGDRPGRSPSIRDQKDDISRLQVRNSRGTMVPAGRRGLRSREINGPLVLTRYNMYPAASINGNACPGVSSGTAIEAMEGLANRELPAGDELRVDRDGLPRAPGRQHGDHRLRLLDRDGLPGAGGAVRELVACRWR